MRRLNSNTAFYKDMMGIKAVTAVSDTELHLEYDALDRSVVLMLAFDPLTKRLVNAQVRHRHHSRDELTRSSTEARRTSRKHSTSPRPATTFRASSPMCSFWFDEPEPSRGVGRQSVVFGL